MIPTRHIRTKRNKLNLPRHWPKHNTLNWEHISVLVTSHVITVGRRVTLGRWQVGTQDGIVEDIEIRWHAVVTFVVVQNLNTNSQGCLYVYICEPFVPFRMPSLPELICGLQSCEPLEVFFSQRMLGLIFGCSQLLYHHICREQNQ